LRTESRLIVSSPRFNVLIVNESAADQRLVEEALTTVAPCAVVGLQNTDEAFKYIDEGRRPDLILLILLTLDSEEKGLEFVRSLKGDHDRQQIPVAVFTSGIGTHEAKAVESAGAIYLQKPLDFDGHVRLASELLSLAES
jgi:CheY-like chemotaxis protein